MNRFLEASLVTVVVGTVAACAVGTDTSSGATQTPGDGTSGTPGTPDARHHDAGATTDGSAAQDASTSNADAGTSHTDASTSGPDASTSGPDASTQPDSGGGGATTLFTQPQPWTTRIDGLAKDGASDTITQALAAAGGWGTGVFQMDTSLEVLAADAQTPMRAFTATSDFYTPDCDHVPFPVPAGGALEGETGYACTTNGDCHLLVVDGPAQKLYEMWRADINGSTFNGGCAAVWDLSKVYPANLRGDGCSSADAGGFPITAMLASADEVAAGAVAHALRFILPNERIRAHAYVHPGSHTTNPTAGGPNLPPYGVRFRLRGDYPLASLPNQAARVLAVALQRYGMFLADGGNVPLTVRSDRSTRASWASLGIDTHSLDQLKVTDMEVVGMGATSSVLDCTRNP